MNYIGAIVKILENPQKKFLDSTFIIQVRAQLPQIRKSRVVKLLIWGNLSYAFINYYKKNDYILIEGYTSVRDSITSENKKPLKKVTITVLKAYPMLLSSNRSIKKLS